MGLADSVRVPDTSKRARIDVENGVLIGSRCSSCGATSWPTRAICHKCGAPDMYETPFAPTGALLAFTTVWVARVGLDAPYMLGQIKLADGPIVFGHVRGISTNTGVPSQMRLFVGGDGSVPPFWFEPEEER